MANFDLKYDFTPHLENTEETEEFNWYTLEKNLHYDNELACLDVCYDIWSTSQHQIKQHMRSEYV